MQLSLVVECQFHIWSKNDRNELSDWALEMDKKGKLEEYKEKHFIPVDLTKV